MFDSSKFSEFFDPSKVKEPITIVGCGAVGSTIAELLVRIGLTNFILYDFDLVESHNIANQMFRHIDINKKKTQALSEMMLDINPELNIDIHDEYIDQQLNGYVFLAVDSIELRKKICEINKMNIYVKAIFDTRMRLTDAQAFAADWSEYKDKMNLLNSMNFSDDDAKQDTPVSACNVELSVAPTVRLICNYVVVNFMNFILEKDFKKMILIDAFTFVVNAF